MKKRIIALLIFMAIATTGCGANSTETAENTEATIVETTTKDTTNEATVDTTTDADLLTSEYLSDFRVLYEQTENQYYVLFGLQNINRDYITESGVADIQIINDSGDVVYNQSIDFTSNDFQDWGVPICSLSIPTSSIEARTEDQGKLYLTVSTDTAEFDELSDTVSNLPLKEASVTLPSLPYAVSDRTRSRYTMEATVSNITYESEIYNSSDMTLTFCFTITLDSKTDKLNTGEPVHIGYRVVNSSGIVVDSDQTSTSSIFVGDTTEKKVMVFDLDPNDSYSIELIDAT